METFWRKFDMSNVYAKLQDLEKLLSCPLCHKIPEGDTVFLETSCRHQLCANCYNHDSWNGSCPVFGCGQRTYRKDVHMDRSKAELLQGLRNLKSMFGQTDDNMNVDLNDTEAIHGFDGMITISSKKNEENRIEGKKTNDSKKAKQSNEQIEVENGDNGSKEESESFDALLSISSKKTNDSKKVKNRKEQIDVHQETSEESNVKKVKKSVPAKKAVEKKTEISSSFADDNPKENEDIIPSSISFTETRKTRRSKPPAKKGRKEKKEPETKDTIDASSMSEQSFLAPSTSKTTKNNTQKLNKKNKKGETPLHAACCKRDLNAVKKFLEQGAETNTQDNNGWTPLHEVAPFVECLEIVELLLNHGADPNVPGGDMNTTPLHEASSAGCAEICKILVQKGANKTARDSSGKTPIEAAQNQETKDIIEETDAEVTDTEQLETTMLLNASTVPERFVLFLHSNLKSDQKSAVKAASKKLGFTVSNNINEEVTHILVNLHEETTSCEADITFYQSILMGKWIVDFKWFEASNKNTNFANEIDFVAEGCHDCRTGAPFMAKTNFSNRRPRLFDGCHIYLTGYFSKPYPSKSDLISLLKNGGATILRREPDPEYIPMQEQRLPYHVKTGSPLEKCSHYIIYQEGDKEPILKYNMSHCMTLPAAWLFECIKNFSLVPPFK